MDHTREYRCNACGLCHETLGEAAECCPDVTEVFVCGHCKTGHENASDAERCCAPAEEQTGGKTSAGWKS